MRETGRKQSLIEKLTKRELQVLALIGQGLSAKEIATRLGLSPKTIHSHGSNIMGKLAIHDRVLLAHFAIRPARVDSLLEPPICYGAHRLHTPC